MDTKIQEAWLLALESGHVNQGQNTLKGREGFCCLGLLSCIVRDQFPEVIPDGMRIIERSREITILYDGNTMHHTIGNDLATAVGLTKAQVNRAMTLNDGSTVGSNEKPQSFWKIAQWIRAGMPVSISDDDDA